MGRIVRAGRWVQSVAWSIVVLVVGVAVIVVGIILIPLPFPISGWFIVFGGLGILASRFPVARRVMDWLRVELTDVPPIVLGGGTAAVGVVFLLVPWRIAGREFGAWSMIVFGLVIATFQLPQLRPTARKIYARVRPDLPQEGAGHAGALDDEG